MTSPRTPRQPRERGCFHTAPCSCPNRYLSEVLPETPEPPREGSYFDRTSFADEEAEAARAAQAPVPAYQSVPAVPVSSTGGKETGEAAEGATEALSPVPYAEHERIVLEEIDRRDEAEEWADKLAAALAPPHVVGGHSLKNHPWRNALEWAQENRGPLPDSETEWQWGCGSSIDEIFSLDEATAREHAASTGVLRKRRKAGPWIEVTS